jgi:solute carrier family 25 protein 39/40
MATATQTAQDADVTAGAGEVSLPQKMLSAVSGSILTSLLGESLSCLVAIALASSTVAASPLSPRTCPPPHCIIR